MKKQRYPDIISEYSVSINDLSLYLFIPKSPKLPSTVAEVKPFLHTHSYIEIFVCTEDKFSIATDDGMITLFANDIALLPANLSHSAISGRKNFITLGMMGAKNDIKAMQKTFNEFSELFKLSSARIYRNAASTASKLIKMHKCEYPEESATPAIQMAALLTDLLLFSYEETASPSDKKCDTDGKDIMRFLIIEETINNGYTERVDPDEVAARLYITRRHLDRIVRERYEKTLCDLILENRVKLARQLLSESDLSLELIAQKCGFPSVLSFKHGFAKIMGASPSEYRKNRKNG
jgi:AraC-like DNA-binding protein